MTSTTPLSYDDVLARVSSQRQATDAVVGTMTAGTIWPRMSQQPMDIVMHAPMGMASPMGLGIALGRPDLGVIVLDSDGAILMNLGSLVTIGGERPAKFLHIVFENSVYDMTGGQTLPGSGTAGLPFAAEAFGYHRAERITDLGAVDRAISDMHAGSGPILLAIPVTRGWLDLDLAERGNEPAGWGRAGADGFTNLRNAIAATAG